MGLRAWCAVAALGVAMAQPAGSAAPAGRTGVHGVWVWDTADVTGSEAGTARFIAALRAIGATDAYLFLPAKAYAAPQLARALAELARAGLHSWGLEGAREYFSDIDGPGGLYAAADALAAFNQRHGAAAGFTGFVSDMEPQDGQGPDFPVHFHNDIADSKLTERQAADRQALMADWLSIHRELRARMAAAGLRYAAAVPSWTDDYFGEPVHVVVDGRRQDIQLPLMQATGNYIVMCYNTDPAAVTACLRRKITDAGRLGAAAPLVLSAVETHAGAGPRVSYADDPAKGTRRAVLNDLQVIRHALQGEAGFGGTDVHDWAGWRALRP